MDPSAIGCMGTPEIGSVIGIPPVGPRTTLPTGRGDMLTPGSDSGTAPNVWGSDALKSVFMFDEDERSCCKIKLMCKI